ncbi:1-amino-cyclopropane-1-carboxylate synthase 12 isoform X1 [Carex rostrata]
MTRASRDSDKSPPEHNLSSSRLKSDGPEMRIIVPLQGVVQGRGGLVLGSLLPCALFYFLQLYLKSRNRPSQSRPSSPPPLSTPNDHISSPSSPSSASGSSIHRTLSRGLLSPRVHPSVSSRAAAIARPDEDSSYYVGLKRCREDAYHRVDNPEGILQLGLAENWLSQDLVLDWLEKKAHGALLGGERPDELNIMGLTTYQPFDGSNSLKIAVAGFMNQVMQGSVSFDPSQIVLTCGATPAMEILSFCIADQGNAFLVPSPYYPGWDRDIKWRTGVELVPVPCRSTDNFSISTAALERTYTQAKKRGLKIRAVLIANPTNPTGHVLSRETLIDLLDFVTEKNIHLISDEVFAGSIHGDQSKFVSVAEILESEGIDKTRVHIIYGLSKDLPLAGFRVGVIHSYNDTVIAASAKLARFSSISAPTQQLLTSMLSDMQFISDYLEVNQQRLRRMHSLFVVALKQLGIECANSNAGFYCWADMSRYIKSYSEKGERQLWEKLLTVAKVNMTPGLSCHCIEPGWFRCCFTTLTEEDIPLVVERIKRVTQGPK